METLAPMSNLQARKHHKHHKHPKPLENLVPHFLPHEQSCTGRTEIRKNCAKMCKVYYSTHSTQLAELIVLLGVWVKISGSASRICGFLEDFRSIFSILVILWLYPIFTHTLLKPLSRQSFCVVRCGQSDLLRHSG